MYRFDLISIKISTNLLEETEDHPKFHVKIQEIQNSQSNFQKEQTWRRHISLVQNIVQSYSNEEECGIFLQIDIQIYGMKMKHRHEAHIFIIYSFITRMP